MTNEEAIKRIEDDMRLHHDALSGQYRHALRMAVDALKAHEPVEAKVMGESKSHGSWWFACGACGYAIDPEDNFCRECGRKMKWK